MGSHGVKQVYYRNIMVVMGLLAVFVMTLTIKTSMQINRDLEQMLIDVQEMEEMSIQMDKEQKALLKELEEIHSPKQEPYYD